MPTARNKPSYPKRWRRLKNLRIRHLVGLAAILGALAGILLALVIRFATYQTPGHVHYHANFDVYINGHQQIFRGPLYFEETVACSQAKHLTPESRVHMHDSVGDVIHVHDNAVTWGDFFTNINWYIGEDFLKTADHLYLNDGQHKLSIILNGQNLTGISSIAGQVIHDRDRLLVSYGGETSAQLNNQYQSVPATAAKYDASSDPASCGGSASASFSERLKHLF